jgi:hypothetical protein
MSLINPREHSELFRDRERPSGPGRNSRRSARQEQIGGADTIIGPLSWDEKGDPQGFESGVFQWHADGSSTAAE